MEKVNIDIINNNTNIHNRPDIQLNDNAINESKIKLTGVALFQAVVTNNLNVRKAINIVAQQKIVNPMDHIKLEFHDILSWAYLMLFMECLLVGVGVLVFGVIDWGANTGPNKFKTWPEWIAFVLLAVLLIVKLGLIKFTSPEKTVVFV